MRGSYLLLYGIGELYTGELLFATHENLEHLHMINKLAIDCSISSDMELRQDTALSSPGMLNMFPMGMLNRMHSSRRDKYFICTHAEVEGGVYKLRELQKADSRKAVDKMIVLSDMFKLMDTTLYTTLDVCNYYPPNVLAEIQNNLCKCKCGCHDVLYNDQTAMKCSTILHLEMFELCNMLLTIDPVKRISAKKALSCPFLNK